MATTMHICHFLKKRYGPTDGPTNGPMDGQTASYRDAKTHLESLALKHITGIYFHTKNQRHSSKGSQVIPFLDASSHLYMRLCPSVHRFVGPSVRRSDSPSVRR